MKMLNPAWIVFSRFAVRQGENYLAVIDRLPGIPGCKPYARGEGPKGYSWTRGRFHFRMLVDVRFRTRHQPRKCIDRCRSKVLCPLYP
jgi:hypothetical protein